MATGHLLEEFPSVSTAAWEATIARDLRGAAYEKKLIWRTEEGLAVKPYYRADDLQGLACLDASPGEFPYRRGGSATGEWRIREEIWETDALEANRASHTAIAAGAEAIAFTRARVRNGADLEVLLANLSEIPVHFACADEQLIRLVIERLNMRGNAAEISTGCDALSSLEFAAEAIGAPPAGFVPFTIHGELFEEAGATAAEEVGFTLAAGVDFLAAIDERGVALDRAAAAIEFSFAIGSNYFFQIAKLRAFRMVWARALDIFGVKSEAARARIAARTSRWNKTVYDPHVNILRATTEAMSAILGGADAVTVLPFDACSKEPDEASRRLARNTQLLLKHEACLNRTADAGGGSYYLETLTDFIARESWKAMQAIEARGGFRKTQTEGWVAQALERSMAAREKAVVSRRRVVVGTNQYSNRTEQALDRVDFIRINETKRGARIYAELRLRTERHAAKTGKTPHVVLAEIGDARIRSARSNFSANLFACAGFEISAQRFKKTAEIAAAEGDLIVLCSADTEYTALVAELMPKMKEFSRKTPVIVAGNPEGAVELTAAGIADFVNVRSNPIEVLTRWQQRLGIED